MQARAHAPSVVFFDELDALGRSRSHSGQVDGGTDERETTLNELLVQMDGFGSASGAGTGTDGVLVLAATNRPDLLDSALKRPGRFDRTIDLPLPDRQDRYEIFRVHLSRLTLDPLSLQLNPLAQELARVTPGWTGAWIGSVCNDAALLAARSGADLVTRVHLDTALHRAQQRGKTVACCHRRAVPLSQAERAHAALHTASRVAGVWYHEQLPAPSRAGVGETIVGFGSVAPGWISAASPFSRCSHGELVTAEELYQQLVALLAGRASEELWSSLTTANQEDLNHATTLAYTMVTQYGMGKVGPIAFGKERVSKATQTQVDQAAQDLLRNANQRAKRVLLDHTTQIQALAKVLEQCQVVGEQQMQDCLGARQRPTSSCRLFNPLPPALPLTCNDLHAVGHSLNSPAHKQTYINP